MPGNSLDTVIAVMGMTGSGKSSFIKSVSGRKDVLVGHKLSSATENVTPYRFKYAGANFTLIDTPGFDDSRSSDDVIADRLLEWLRQGQRLNGIIYIHRINQPRMQGTALSNMNMFRRLCGPDCFRNVVLATSFWSEVDPAEGAQRESELCNSDEFWGKLVKKGSRVVRVGLDPKADERLLLKIAQNNKVILQAQQEMQDGRQNCETSAAQETNRNLSEWKRFFDTQLKAEEEQMRRELADSDERAQQLLEAQRTAFRAERERQKEERKRYKAENAAMKESQMKHEVQLSEMKRLREARKREKDLHERLKQEQQTYYDSYRCKQTTKHRRIVCNNCGDTIKHRREQFYHCCHCDDDDFDLCTGCGPKCDNSDHPPMKLCGGE